MLVKKEKKLLKMKTFFIEFISRLDIIDKISYELEDR